MMIIMCCIPEGGPEVVVDALDLLDEEVNLLHFRRAVSVRAWDDTGVVDAKGNFDNLHDIHNTRVYAYYTNKEDSR